MYYVYVLRSAKDGRTYVGYAANVAARIREHNAGKVKAARNRRPLNVLFTESCENLALAKHHERYWKSGGGRRKLVRYFKSGFPPITS